MWNSILFETHYEISDYLTIFGVFPLNSLILEQMVSSYFQGYYVTFNVSTWKMRGQSFILKQGAVAPYTGRSEDFTEALTNICFFIITSKILAEPPLFFLTWHSLKAVKCLFSRDNISRELNFASLAIIREIKAQWKFESAYRYLNITLFKSWTRAENKHVLCLFWT